jgi:hypothetical protein
VTSVVFSALLTHISRSICNFAHYSAFGHNVGFNYYLRQNGAESDEAARRGVIANKVIGSGERDFKFATRR